MAGLEDICVMRCPAGRVTYCERDRQYTVWLHDEAGGLHPVLVTRSSRLASEWLRDAASDGVSF